MGEGAGEGWVPKVCQQQRWHHTQPPLSFLVLEIWSAGAKNLLLTGGKEVKAILGHSWNNQFQLGIEQGFVIVV